jgi:hypothetical protein
MASKMSMSREDSIVGYNKRVANYTDIYDDSDDDSENGFYNHYEPFEEEFDFNNNDGDYQPFIPEEEEKEHKSFISSSLKRSMKPFVWMNSPTKSVEKSPKIKSQTWWDKNETIEESKRVVNGVLNYAALLPPPTRKVEVQPKKFKKTKKKGGKQQIIEKKEMVKKPPSQPVAMEVQKPTRFCLSIIKKSKCFHGAQCRFAHDYADLKECNFGVKCKKIVVTKTNADGTVELANKNEIGCNFKHGKESKNSYLKRIPQHTSPKRN